MSVHTTNALNTAVLSTVIQTGAVAWAASALSSPIGPLGGAIFGAVSHIAAIPLAMFGPKCLHTEHPDASTSTKTLGLALEFFGSYAAAWGALVLAGFPPLAFTHIVGLTIVSTLTAIAIEISLRCAAVISQPGHLNTHF